MSCSTGRPGADSSTTPPVLVLGKGRTALGVIRSLGRAGISSIFTSYEPDFVVRSRWARPIPISAAGLPGTRQLNDLLERFPSHHAVLLPCADSWTRAVAALDSRLALRFPASVSSLQTQEILTDKGRFAELLKSEGIPHPRTIILGGQGKEEMPFERVSPGWFLKPCDSQLFSTCFGIKAITIRSHADAMSRLRELREKGFSFVLQEYIPGPPTAHIFIDGFVDRGGKVCARFARRRIRMFPADYGNSSAMISIPLKEVGGAVEALDRLLAAVNFRGIFSAEFKYDGRDGLYKILEINARPWWFVEFASNCGVNVCRMAYEDALGREVKPILEYKAGVWCVDFLADLHCCWCLYRKRELTLPAWLGSWWSADKVEFCLDDPLPGICLLLPLIRDFVRHRILRIDDSGGQEKL